MWVQYLIVKEAFDIIFCTFGNLVGTGGLGFLKSGYISFESVSLTVHCSVTNINSLYCLPLKLSAFI